MRFPKLIPALLFSFFSVSASADPINPAALANNIDQLINALDSDAYTGAVNRYNNSTYNPTGLPSGVRLPGLGATLASASPYNVMVCAPFVSEMMKQTHNLTNTQYSALFGSTSPSSSIYYTRIVANSHFVRKTRVTDIQRGDIGAMQYGCPNEDVTGHTFVALAAPEPYVNDAYMPQGINAVKVYRLLVGDSTSSRHSFDSREATSKRAAVTGAGRGYMKLYADANGNIVAYAWTLSGGSSVRGYAGDCRQIAFGTPY